MNIQPRHDYYLIRLIEPEEKTTDGGIVLPESVQKKMPTVMGVVVRESFGMHYAQEPYKKMEGQTVIIKPDATIMYEAVDMGEEGKFFLVEDKNIIAFLDESLDEEVENG